MFESVNTMITALYVIMALIFLVNSGLEEVSRGGRPGLTVLGVALFWPILLAAVVIHVLVAYLWSRLHHQDAVQPSATTTLHHS